MSQIPRLLLLPLLAAAAAAQSNVVGPYDSGSFESPRYAAGALPGPDYSSGQDGWLLLDDLAYPAHYSGVQVQSQIVRSGQQAIRWDAATMTPGSNCELRRNAMFSLTTGVLEMEFDFLLTSGSQPSGAWGFYTQPYPHPQSALMWWEIRASGEVWYCSTANRVWNGTGTFVARNQWHHARTVVDVFGNQTRLYLDGVRIAQGQPTGVNYNGPDHGFSQFWCNAAGNDSFCFDNLTIRERTAPLGTSSDLPQLRVGQRGQLRLHLLGSAAVGGHAYALLGSLAGTSPGVPLVPGVTLPLQPDWLFGVLAGGLGSPSLPGFLGTMPTDGDVEVGFDTLVPVPPALVGQTLSFAWFTYFPAVAASEPVRILLVP